MDKKLKTINQLLGSKNIKTTGYLRSNYVKKYKIVVFTPPDKTDEITHAMASEGAGKIGEYSDCSFRIKGTGTFKGGKKTKPYIGTKGKFEKAEEVRLEMICDAEHVDNAVEAMLKVHPYEEPAYEIYEVLVRVSYKNHPPLKITLKKPLTGQKLLRLLNKKLNTHHLPDKLNALMFNALIFDDSQGKPYFSPAHDDRTLYLSLSKKGTYNIRLNIIQDKI